ncbi:MAG: DUF4080 domain-containing protein [Rhodoferax sp.]|nr:DUF4080 domain-containing protein [Rhodoferax sp.]
MPWPAHSTQPGAGKPGCIVLCTLNAKYIHAALGLRYLLANMGDLSDRTVLREYTLARDPQEMADELLALAPAIIGLGVYIWNVRASTELVRQLKARNPGVRIVLGGPEVSHESDQQSICAMADHVITGWGDVSFPKLCRALLFGPQLLMKVIVGAQPSLDQIALPYGHYSDADLAHRLIYVEASRGCPFKCEFCLSSLDATAWAFDTTRFLGAMDSLYQRGARNFKFVDRTFNLKIEHAVRILQFFLDRLSPDLLLHFEVIPDHLPDRLKALLVQFPAGTLQLEVGVQTFNTEVQQRIARKQNNERTESNLRWLAQHSHAHLHADLIFGLPGETLQSFAAGFDRLHALQPDEIQLGLLKRLRGTPIARHTLAFDMVYDPEPPYALVQSSTIDADTVLRFSRLARYWDLVANSGRFTRTLRLLLLGPSAFAAFWDWSEYLWSSTRQTQGLTPEQLVDSLWQYLTAVREQTGETVRTALLEDFVASGARASPKCLRGLLPPYAPIASTAKRALARRQDQHLKR